MTFNQSEVAFKTSLWITAKDLRGLRELVKRPLWPPYGIPNA